MTEKPTYEELKQRVNELEKEAELRRQAVNALKQNENDMRAVLDAVTETIVLINRQGRVITVNQTCCDRLRSTKEELLGRCVYDVFSPDVAENRRQKWEEVFNLGRPVSFEDSRAGMIFEQSVYPVFGDDGQVEKIAIFARDVTDRKQAIEQLMHFKAAVALSSDAIGISTPAGRHWYQNEAFDNLFGNIGEDPPATAYVDERVGREVFKVVMAGGQWAGEVMMHAKDASIRHILLRAYATKDQKGQVLGLVGTHTDMTRRKRAEEALRESEESLRAFLAANPGPMVMYNPAGEPKFMNSAFTEVFGWTLDEVKGREIPFVPDDQKELTGKEIREIYRSGSTSRFETRRLTMDGRTLDVIVSAALAKGPEGSPEGMVVNLTDITEQKSLQAKYEQAQKMESIGTLAGGIAHDFNNLLMGIQGRASLMASDLEPDHPLFEHVRGIEEYVRSASDLTRQLLGFARGGKYEVKPVDINEVVLGSSAMFGRTKKEIRIHTKTHSQPLVVEADQRQIEQVLLNLYVNAWQAMPDGGELFLATKPVTLEDAFCKPHGTKSGRYVRVSVTDTGIGMDEGTRQRIFDPFFTTKEKARGTGLGLASAYGIIRNHGGMITVYSELGHGSTFHIYLPISCKEVYREVHMEEQLVTGSETILLVDDEEIIIEVAQAMLKKLGYDVFTAKGGREAVDLVRSRGEEIHLVILDMIMPEMDGGKTFDRIRELRPGMPVVLSSGYAINGQAGEIMRRGCNGFIQKPFTIAELSRKVRHVLNDSKIT